jgi:hypothetical protein
MSQSTPPASPTSAPENAAGLARLHKMSTTAGVGLGEYRAVNGLAVTSLVLGIASWMSWLHPMLFLLPVVGVVMGVLAIVQIRRSSGTQSGIGLAGTGIVLSMLLGGWAFTVSAGERHRVIEHRREIDAVAVEFGEALAAADYARAYRLTDTNFQREISLERFVSVFSSESGRLGGFHGAASNSLARVVVPEEGPPTAEARLIIQIGLPDPFSQTVRLVRREEGWRFTEFEAWFPRQGAPG